MISNPTPSAPSPVLDSDRKVELVVINGIDRAEIIDTCKVVLRYIDSNPDTRMVDMAYTLWQPFSPSTGTDTPAGSLRLSVVAADLPDLASKLRTSVKLLEETDRKKINNRKGIFFTEDPLAACGKLAMLFPGEVLLAEAGTAQGAPFQHRRLGDLLPSSACVMHLGTTRNMTLEFRQRMLARKALAELHAIQAGVCSQ